MNEQTADNGYADDDRLPWLETVEDDYAEGPSIWRIILLVLLGLAVIAAAIYGYYWYQQNRGTAGTGALINAQEGDYKVRPDNPGGLQVEGEGDTQFAASEGAVTNAQVNTAAVPEAPIEPKRATPAPKAASGGGSIVQLGSFPSEAAANAAWTQLSGRFSYLAPLGKSIETGEVKGNTVYRLRVNAGSAGQAQEVCGKLKVAGEACFVAQ